MLEGYVRPWLLSLLQRYLEVKEEDLKLSLWGGDLHLNNVALKVRGETGRSCVPDSALQCAGCVRQRKWLSCGGRCD